MGILSSIIASLIAVAFIGGFGLAIWFENATWLWLSAVAFIVLYAG